jgi:hypothetical protein
MPSAKASTDDQGHDRPARRLHRDPALAPPLRGRAARAVDRGVSIAACSPC